MITRLLWTNLLLEIPNGVIVRIRKEMCYRWMRLSNIILDLIHHERSVSLRIDEQLPLDPKFHSL